MLTQLVHCFKDTEAGSMAAFWEAFKAEEAFEELLTVLNIKGKEKTNWKVSYEYQMQESKGFFAGISSSTHHYFKGATINLSVLKEKADSAAGHIYHFLLDETMSNLEKGKRVKHLVNYHEKEGLTVILFKLEGLLNMLSMPLPVTFDLEKKDDALAQLDTQVASVSAEDINEHRKLRELLLQLQEGLFRLEKDLKKDLENTRLFKEGIQQLKSFIVENSLLLNARDLKQGVILCDNALTERFQAMMLSADIESSTVLQDIDALTSQRCQGIKQLSDIVQNSLGQVKQKGERLSREALTDLSYFLKARKGIWESILRLISPTYKKCMRRIKRILNEPEMMSVDKINQTVGSIESARTKGCWFIQSRLSECYKVGTMHFFAPVMTQKEGTSTREFRIIAPSSF